MDRHSLFHRNTRAADRAVAAPAHARPSGSTPAPLACMLSQLVRSYNGHIDESLSPFGISSAHVPLLHFMWEHYDGHTQSAIAESLCVDKGTVSRNVRALVNAGLMSQSCREDDSRACRLELTASGVALREPVFAAVSEWTTKATAGLSAAEADLALHLLGRMTASTSAQPDAAHAMLEVQSAQAPSASADLVPSFAPVI